jgi:hypothetical protein
MTLALLCHSPVLELDFLKQNQSGMKSTKVGSKVAPGAQRLHPIASGAISPLTACFAGC